tara:strand:+ start:232 stop:480 length:249 start_codon:yes stop_codon:yes gene_type:complete
MKPEVGMRFEMRLDNFPSRVTTFGIVDTDLKDDSHGTIKMEKLKSEVLYTNHVETKEFKPGNYVTVEEMWFTANSKRKFKIL